MEENVGSCFKKFGRKKEKRESLVAERACGSKRNLRGG